MTHPLSLYISSIYHLLLALARALRFRIRFLSGCNSHVEEPLWPSPLDPQLLIKPVRNRMPAKKTSEEKAWINTLHSWNRLNCKSWPTKKKIWWFLGGPTTNPSLTSWYLDLLNLPVRYAKKDSIGCSKCLVQCVGLRKTYRKPCILHIFLPPIAVRFLQNSLDYLWRSAIHRL